MVSFSIVYPTHHRPQFIERALLFLSRQTYKDFEVVISDNFTDPALSCKEICERAAETWKLNIKYNQTESCLNMVENWNRAFSYTEGEYILYLTDKMFLLPDTLERTHHCVSEMSPDIVNWIDNSYSPIKFPNYFGTGIYHQKTSSVSSGEKYKPFNCKEELSKKGLARCSRSEQDPSHYTRGKICFGAYKAALCHKIIKHSGALFHAIAPDYTSMVLALSLAESAMELSDPGIVHIRTDLSNGGNVARNDKHALAFLKSFNNDQIFEELLVPKAYRSANNMVARDYLAIKGRCNLTFEFKKRNWLVYIWEDLVREPDGWSDSHIKEEQLKLLKDKIFSLTWFDRYIIYLSIIHRDLKRNIKPIIKKTEVARFFMRATKIFHKDVSSRKRMYFRTIDGVLNNHTTHFITKQSR